MPTVMWLVLDDVGGAAEEAEGVFEVVGATCERCQLCCVSSLEA